MKNWESLIGERMRPAATVHRIEDPVQRNREENGKRRSKRWRDKHPDYDAEYYASHKEKMRANADKWKKELPEAMREYARRYRARHKDDPTYKAMKKIYNDTYRGKLKKAANLKARWLQLVCTSVQHNPYKHTAPGGLQVCLP